MYSCRSVPQMPHHSTSTSTSSERLERRDVDVVDPDVVLVVEPRCTHEGGPSESVVGSVDQATMFCAAAHLAVDDSAATRMNAPWKRYCQVWLRLRNVVALRTCTSRHGAEQRADEGAAAAEQARAAEHHGGDAGQRVADALRRVADAELRQQHDRAEGRQQRDRDVAEKHGLVDADADAAGRLLVRADGAHAQAAESRLRRAILEGDRHDHQHDEGDRDRPDLRLDGAR